MAEAGRLEREFREFYHKEQMEMYRNLYDDLGLDEEMQLAEMLDGEIDNFIKMYQMTSGVGDLNDEDLEYYMDLLLGDYAVDGQ